MVGVYIHIPFCVKKCGYCDFISYAGADSMKKPYVRRLINEIEAYGGDCDADSVFIGGGTPTTLEVCDLVDIIRAVRQKFNLHGCEFSVEANPKTVNRDGLVFLRDEGVNRISFGLQSAHDGELVRLGRIHSYSDFLNTYNDALAAGFDNINVDLMFGIPHQTNSSWLSTLETVTALKPQHISCYSLIIEENTPFYSMELKLPDEETERKMYKAAADVLKSAGYEHYEISNFSLPRRECRHNLKYWTRKNYVGFGAGACSCINNVRMKNSASIAEYIENNIVEREMISEKDALAEHIILGLRLVDGFDIAELEKHYNINFYRIYKRIIDKYIKSGHLTMDSRLKLTFEGLNVSNTIMCEFL